MEEILYMARSFPELVFSAVLEGRTEVDVPLRLLGSLHPLCVHAVRLTGTEDPRLSRLGELCRLVHLAPSFERILLRPWIALQGTEGGAAWPDERLAGQLAQWQQSETERLELLMDEYLRQVSDALAVAPPDIPVPARDPMHFLITRLRRYQRQWMEAGARLSPVAATHRAMDPGRVRPRPGRASLRGAGWARRSRLTRATLGMDPESLERSLANRVDTGAVYALWCALRFSERLLARPNRRWSVAFRDIRPVEAGGDAAYFDLVGDDVPLGMQVRGIRHTLPDLLIQNRLPREVPPPGSEPMRRAWVKTWFELPSREWIDRDGLAETLSASAAAGMSHIVFCTRESVEISRRWGWKAIEAGVVTGWIEVANVRIKGIACELLPRANAESRNDQVIDCVVGLMGSR